MSERIIERVKKMLALANDLAATEGERDNALRMAYNLMAKYNIDEADVSKESDPRVNFENQSFSWAWARQVNKIIGDLFFCKMYVGSKVNNTQMKFHFVGKESNAMTAAVMADWIVKSILKEARKLYRQNTSPQSREFALGALDSLRIRVRAIKEQQEAEVTKSTGRDLVLASLYKTELEANEEFLASQGIELRTKAQRAISVKDMSAYNGGRAYGDRINLNRQVAGEVTPLVIK